MKLFAVLGELWVFLNSLKDNLWAQLVAFGRSKGVNVLWRCAMFALLWVFWNVHNPHIFHDKEAIFSFDLGQDSILSFRLLLGLKGF